MSNSTRIVFFYLDASPDASPIRVMSRQKTSVNRCWRRLDLIPSGTLRFRWLGEDASLIVTTDENLKTVSMAGFELLTCGQRFLRMISAGRARFDSITSGEMRIPMTTSRPNFTRFVIPPIVPILLACVGLFSCAHAPVEGPPEIGPDELDATPIIDVHTHLFNFRYLPLRGILYRFRVPVPLAKTIAKRFIEKTDEYDLHGLELLELDDLDRLSEEELFGRLGARFLVHQPGLESGDGRFDEPFPLTEMEEDLLHRYVTEVIRREQEGLSRLSQGIAQDRSTESEVEENAILSEFLFGQEGLARAKEVEAIEARVRATSRFKLVLGILKKVLGVVGAPVRFYRLVDILMRNEAGIVRYLQSVEFPQVDIFVHHMMRLDAVYNDSLMVPVAEQIQRNKYLENVSGGKFPFFVAYDPFQLDPEFSDIRNAVGAGATGLKFYPPSGYRPSGTIIPEPPHPWAITPGSKRKIKDQYSSRYGRIKSAEVVSAWNQVIPAYGDLPPEEGLDAINRLAFEKARENDLVVFSHHTKKGFEAWAGYGREMAAPCYWWDVLQDVTAHAHREKGADLDTKPLKLIIAHSGGGRGWFGNERVWRDSFARQAFNLCVSFEHVYCDFGYLDEVLEDDGPKNCRFVSSSFPAPIR